MAYTFEQSYYFRPYRGNSSFWLNRYGNGSIASHQKATLYTAAGSADQRLKVHKVSGGCQLLSDLNNAYGLNIYGTKAGSVCDFYPVSGNFNDALIDLLIVDAANNLYRIKMINHNLYLTPASNSSGAALTWENASNADNQIWQLCASQSSGGGSTGGSTTITMPVNANQNYSGNSSWIINYGCAVCCGVDLASWKKNKSYTISDFANYYDEANGYYWTGPDNFSCSDAISLASLNEAQTIEKIRSYVKNHIPVACHAVGSGSRQHWFVAYTPYSRMAENRIRQESNLQKSKRASVEKKIKTAQHALERFEGEILKCLDGTSNFTEDMIAKQIRRYQQELDDAKAEYAALQNARLNEAAEIRKLRTYYDEFRGWAEEFDAAPLEIKRMILSQLIERVGVGRKYQVTIKLNMEYQQFLEITEEQKLIPLISA